MQFELTDALLEEILFCMEDQEGEFVLDTVNEIVLGGTDGPEIPAGEDDEDGSRFIPLPEWNSASGFRLMERFVSAFHNPLIRDELNSALGQGRRVFRAFKNTLTRYPGAEKRWFLFKEREMKREILRWYNALREEWGLEKIGMEPEETDDLILEDFRLRPFQEEDTVQAEELHRQCLEEFENTLNRQAFLTKAQARENFAPPPSFETAMVAEYERGGLAAYVSGKKSGTVFYIQNLEVKAEFRSLGVGEALLKKLIECLDPAEIDQVLLDLPSPAEGFSRVLHRESFKPYMVRYRLDLRDIPD